MTKQQMIEFIRKKCVEANPEIMELKFGCQINDNLFYVGLGYCSDFPRDENHTLKIITSENGNYKNNQITIKLYPLWRYGHNKDCDGNCGAKDSWDFCQKYHKIIGRPIRLADVLLTMNATHKLPAGSWITSDPYICFHHADTDEELCTWNLRQDDLNDQDESMIEFIYEVLK